MKGAWMLVLFVLAGCVGEGYMRDTPAISPTHPEGDIKVEMEEGNMICITENNDSENRSCVPVVHNSGDDAKGRAR
jgi:hypothetical protein